MTFPNTSAADEYPEPIQTQASAVSWGAIVAGAAGAAALALILLMLGTGLGLSSVSPWAYSGVSATTFGVSTILWLTFTQLVASGMGGYLAGRLRTKWVAVHTDEVYFRDTAHGFLSWAVAALATAALLTSVIGSIVSVEFRQGPLWLGTSPPPRRSGPRWRCPTATVDRWATSWIRCSERTSTRPYPPRISPEATLCQDGIRSQSLPGPRPKLPASL